MRCIKKSIFVCDKTGCFCVNCMKGADSDGCFIHGNPPPEEEKLDSLLVRLGWGDNEALAGLYEETRTSVYAFAFSILKNHADAEDVLQDTYIRLHRAASTYRPEGKPMAYILTVARNLCYQRLREHSRRPEELSEELEGLPEAATVEDRMLLRACLDRLSDGERQVVTLHAIAGLRHREIASLLGMSLSGVLSRYTRAIHKLRQMCEGGTV